MHCGQNVEFVNVKLAVYEWPLGFKSLTDRNSDLSYISLEISFVMTSKEEGLFRSALNTFLWKRESLELTPP